MLLIILQGKKLAYCLSFTPNNNSSKHLPVNRGLWCHSSDTRPAGSTKSVSPATAAAMQPHLRLVAAGKLIPHAKKVRQAAEMMEPWQWLWCCMRKCCSSDELQAPAGCCCAAQCFAHHIKQHQHAHTVQRRRSHHQLSVNFIRALCTFPLLPQFCGDIVVTRLPVCCCCLYKFPTGGRCRKSRPLCLGFRPRSVGHCRWFYSKTAGR